MVLARNRMNAHSPPAENPFCTKRVRPGALSFIFPPDQSAEALVDRLRQANWWGEIVGPHGSGKSTLLATLVPAIEHAGHRTVLVELHDGQRWLPRGLKSDPRLHAPAVLIVDGYEQLSRWSRLLLTRLCRRRRIGLLITTHESVGLPELHRTVATPDLANQIVAELIGDREFRIPTEEVAQSLARRHGDLRETLFDLYDLYEQRRSN
jgi:hypothetical protein